MISALFLTEKVPPPLRASQSAIKYAPFLAASGVAQREHLEEEPVVANELEAQMKLARMQVLANTLYHQMEAQAENVAGGNFDQLQREAYENLGINIAPPPTKLNMVRRTSLFQIRRRFLTSM